MSRRPAPRRNRPVGGLQVAVVAGVVAAMLAACGSPGGAADSASGLPSDGAASPATPPPSVLATPPPSPVGATVTATVTSVSRGDEIVVSIEGQQFTVTYVGIRAPSPAAGGKAAEPFAREAGAANAALVAKKSVVLEQDQTDTDAGGNLLRYVWVENGGRLTLVNLALVSLGFAKAVPSGPDTRYQPLLDAAQVEAQSAGRGMWSAAGPSASSGSRGSPASGASIGPPKASPAGGSPAGGSPAGASASP